MKRLFFILGVLMIANPVFAQGRGGDMDRMPEPEQVVTSTVIDPEALFAQARQNLHKEKYQEAIDGFTKAIEARPDFVKAYELRAEAYSFTQNYEKAWADIDKAIELGGGSDVRFLIDQLQIDAPRMDYEAVVAAATPQRKTNLDIGRCASLPGQLGDFCLQDLAVENNNIEYCLEASDVAACLDQVSFDVEITTEACAKMGEFEDACKGIIAKYQQP